MNALIGILPLLLLASTVLADPYGADAGTAAGDTGKTAEALPSAPHNIKVNSSPQTLELIWQNPEEEQDQVTEYEIARSSNYSGPYTTIASVGKGVYRYIDSTASPEVVYFYKVRAVSGDRYSSYTGIVTGEIALPGYEKGRRR